MGKGYSCEYDSTAMAVKDGQMASAKAVDMSAPSDHPKEMGVVAGKDKTGIKPADMKASGGKTYNAGVFSESKELYM